MTKRTRFVVGLFVALGVGTVICVGLVFWLFFRDEVQERLSRKRFETVAWQAGQSRTNAVRIRMVDDLLRRHRFIGMARGEVTSIIGEPDKTEYFRDWDMVYWLGPERGFMGVDSEWLVFRIDSEKRVVDYKIVRD
jgi:hypothetical protein